MASESFTSSLRNLSMTTPELPEEAAFDVLDKLEAYEKQLILPKGAPDRDLQIADYAEGSARRDDQLGIFSLNHNGVLVSADHATDPVRKATRIREGADHGTAGIARLLVDRGDTTAIVPLGRQTGNAATTPEHPVKVKMRNLLRELNSNGFVSIHGMMPGKVLGARDKGEIHALIGLGKQPNEESRETAQHLVELAQDIGLRALIGNDVRYMSRNPNSGEFERNDQGEIKTGQLAALGVESTTNFARKVFDDEGQNNPALQIELTRGLRLIPEDFENGWHIDRPARAMGVYAGYLLCSRAVDLIMANNE